jgi:aldose 1-epimerase
MRRAAAAAARVSTFDRPFGVTVEGPAVFEYAIRGEGITVRFLNYGGTITAIEVPDRSGAIANVVLSLPDIRAYEASK